MTAVVTSMGNCLRMNPLWMYFAIVFACFFLEVTNGKKLYTAIGMKNKFACVAENLKVMINLSI